MLCLACNQLVYPAIPPPLSTYHLYKSVRWYHNDCAKAKRNAQRKKMNEQRKEKQNERRA